MVPKTSKLKSSKIFMVKKGKFYGGRAIGSNG